MDSENIGNTLITLLIIGVIAFVAIRVFGMLSDSTSFNVASSTTATQVKGNFTTGIWNAVMLLSNIPYLIGALGLLAVVMLFGYYAGGGKIR